MPLLRCVVLLRALLSCASGLLRAAAQRAALACGAAVRSWGPPEPLPLQKPNPELACMRITSASSVRLPCCAEASGSAEPSQPAVDELASSICSEPRTGGKRLQEQLAAGQEVSAGALPKQMLTLRFTLLPQPPPSPPHPAATTAVAALLMSHSPFSKHPLSPPLPGLSCSQGSAAWHPRRRHRCTDGSRRLRAGREGLRQRD